MMGEKILTASWIKADLEGEIMVSFYTFDR